MPSYTSTPGPTKKRPRCSHTRDTVLENGEGASSESVKVEVRDLHKSFDEVEVLKGISFKVGPGELDVVQGATAIHPGGCRMGLLGA